MKQGTESGKKSPQRRLAAAGELARRLLGKSVVRRVCAPLLAGCLALLAAPGAQAGPQVKWKDVRDPQLGKALFNLYQDRNFTGIIELSHALHTQKLRAQSQDAELALVMLDLSYGLHRRAGARLASLMNRGDTRPDITNQIWFYAAKIRYQRGYFNQAESALANISGALPWELEQDLQSFSALLMMDRDQYPEAAQLLSQVKGRTGGVPFARYNTGIALIQAKKKDEGRAVLDKLVQTQADTEEARTLRDRAHVSLGYLQLLDNQPQKAKAYFEQVRLKSSQSNEALLGLGWVHYNLGDFSRALVPWMELSGRNVADTNVQEARVAVPYALIKLDAYRQAKEQYEFAFRSFKEELARLDSTIASVKKGAYFDKLLAQSRWEDGEKGWYGEVYSLPAAAESYYFTQMLARHDYQETLKNYRDLRYLEQKLNVWSTDLGAQGDTVAGWSTDVDNRVRRGAAATFAARVNQMRQLRDGYVAELARIEAQHDAPGLASEKELQQLARLKSLEASPPAGSAEQAQAYRTRLRVLRGRILWNVHSQYNTRLFNMKNALAEMEKTIETATAQQNRLADASQKAALSSKNLQQRTKILNNKITQLRPRITGALESLEDYLKVVALQDMEKRKQILSEFLAQVAFSVGQANDPGPGGGTPKR